MGSVNSDFDSMTLSVGRARLLLKYHIILIIIAETEINKTAAEIGLLQQR